MIEKVHQLKKNVILCKTVPNDLENFNNVYPAPQKMGSLHPPDVCQFTYNKSPHVTPREKIPPTLKHNTRNIFSSPMCNLRAF